jgi:hypothetical protein
MSFKAAERRHLHVICLANHASVAAFGRSHCPEAAPAPTAGTVCPFRRMT